MFTNAADAAPSSRLRATDKWRPDVAAGGDVAAMTVRVVGQAVEARARAHTSAQHDLCSHKEMVEAETAAGAMAKVESWLEPL